MRYQHQIEVLDESWDKKAWAFFLETGTGKTAIAIDNACKLFKEGKIDGVLVIAPKTVYKGVWTRQINQFCEVPYRIGSWSATRNYHQDHLFSGLVDNVYKTEKLVFLLVNVEAFSTKTIFPYILRFLNHYKTMIIIDESARIKNGKAKRTQDILKFSPFAEYRRIMSGFPILNSPQDLYAQVLFLGADLLPFASFYAFRNYFCTLRNINEHVQIETGYKNLEKLTEILRKFSSRRLKKDCLDLPPKIYEPRYVEMTAEQKILYKSMKDKGFAELNKLEVVTAMNFLTQAGKLHQIANGILISSMGDRSIPNNKYDALLEILETEATGSVAIAACYVKNVQQINLLVKAKYGNTQCSAIAGDTPIAERERAIDRFQSGKQRFLVINPSTVREGIDLFFGHTCIFFNNSFHLDYRIQFEDRFHRIGQVNKVTYIDLLTEDTVDDEVLSALMDKQEVGSLILGDNWKRWFI